MNELSKRGCVNIWVDEIVPCLKDKENNDQICETFVFRVESRSYLKKFQHKNGWMINWNELDKSLEIYALALKETNEVQGLIALKNDSKAKACYIHWACTAPWNNSHDFGKQRYTGVGGHLFAIACDKSKDWGYNGVVYGFALNEKLILHYIERFNAQWIGILHPYHFLIDEESANKLLEVYNYEWEE